MFSFWADRYNLATFGLVIANLQEEALVSRIVNLVLATGGVLTRTWEGVLVCFINRCFCGTLNKPQ